MKSNLKEALLQDKRVLLRADLNVPRKPDGSIANDFRIKALLPTLDLILEKGGKIILLTHCGQPKKKEPRLSTKIFVDWFKKHGYSTIFAPTLEKAQEISTQKNTNLIILENLRFWPQEQTNDTTFAKQLAELGDYYVNDAFGALHRTDTSLTILPKLFSPNKKTIGLLIEKELHKLNEIRTHAQSPFVLLQGGVKGKTKLALLKALLHKATTILISTPLCFSFLKAQNKNTGSSFIEDDLLPHIKDFLTTASKNNVEIILPIDYQVSTHNFEKPSKLHEVTTLKNGDIGISIGPETAKLFAEYLKKSKTVFANGLPGNRNFSETLEGTRILLQALRHTNGLHVLAGGDSIDLVEQLGFNDVGYLSTGGGATLAYLSGQPLPGLAALSN